MKTKYKIGIDPDVSKSGFCAVSQCGTRLELIELSNLDFFDCTERIKYYADMWTAKGYSYIIVIEQGELNKALFTAHKAKTNGIAAKIGMNTGKNFAISDLLISYCQRNSIAYKTYQPTTAKLKQNIIAKIFPSVKRSNSEQRDAIRCIL